MILAFGTRINYIKPQYMQYKNSENKKTERAHSSDLVFEVFKHCHNLLDLFKIPLDSLEVFTDSVNTHWLGGSLLVPKASEASDGDFLFLQEF